MKRNRRTMLMFYLMIGYIFISFSWWIVLLIQVTNESYAERRELLQLNFNYQNETADQFLQSSELRKMDEERHRKYIMITGEGSVFLLLLLVVTWKVNQSIKREIQVNRQQKNFLLSITHEFRSPIASSKVALQTLLMRNELPRDKSELLIKNSLQDTERLQSLVENLLLAAKLEDHSFRVVKESCTISELALNAIERIIAATGGHRKFLTDIQSDIIIAADSMGITSVMNNLLENAVKYSEEGNSISVVLKREGMVVKFSVADEGRGITDEEKSKIFQMFYRSGEEETRTTKGTGIGLFIAEGIVALHHGRINVLDNQPKGSIFEMELPV